MKNIAIVTHKYLPQPDDDLVLYLNRKKRYKILHIEHRIPDSDDRKSFVTEYVNGRKIKTGSTYDFKFFPEPVIYLKDAFFTFKTLWSIGHTIDTYIGMDGLSAFFGIVLKKIGKCKRVIYWSMDFVPRNRFRSNILNYFYNTLNSISCKNADEVWDLSPRMAEGRKKYLGIQEKDYKKHMVVPYGLWVSRINRIDYQKCDKNTLVYMGHLLPKQGIDVVLKRIPAIVKKVRNFKFKIIGGGSYKEALINMSKDLRVDKYCEFLGRIDSSEIMEGEIAKAAAAIAPYKKTKDNYTYYADPGKVKSYLACGVPVLLTDLPWNSEEIEEKQCGMIIKDDGSDLVSKLIKMLKPEINKKYRKRAAEYSKTYEYNKIFSSLDL